MRLRVACLLGVLLVAACGSDATPVDRAEVPADTGAADSSTTMPPAPERTTPSIGVSTTTLPTNPRPDWLGTRVLPLRPDGLGEIQPTPAVLVDRRFATIDLLPPPETDEFTSTIGPVPDAVLARSTWSQGCPVASDDLRYVTVMFRGFDGLAHTGELLVHADAAEVMVAGFEHLYDRRFPIEEMRVTRADELDVPPTGDGNNTSAFVCRPSVGSTSWSQHAYGRAVDINPFHNPYVRGDVVIPELASSYAGRPDLPGVLRSDDVAGFTDQGWGWGGTWRSSQDHMHLSAENR